jgi:hypothetical protein
MRKFVHLILLAFIPILSFSQLQIKLPNDVLHYRLDLKEGTLWKERLSQKWTNEGKLASEGLILSDLPPNPNINCFKIDSHYVFTFPGTGQVYQFNLMKRQLKRLDKTYYRGFNFGAIQFVRQDTLYSLGGTGFWHSNNIETYFSFKTKEWELKNTPTDLSPKWMMSDFGGYDAKRDVVSVIESPSLYQQVNKIVPLRYFEKNMNSDKWTYLGDVDTEYMFSLGLRGLNSNFILGKFLFFNGTNLVWADPEENKIYQVNNVDSRFNYSFEYTGKHNMIYLYYHEKMTNQNRIDSISIDKLKSISTYKGSFYIKPYPDDLLAYGGAAIVFIIGGAFFAYRKRNSFNVPDSLDEPLDGLPTGASAFLNACLQYPQGHTFSSQHFTEMMGYGSYAYETQRQVRAKLIKGINSYFWAHYRIEEVIVRQTANDDKRFSVYLIAESHYDTLKKLLN